jgi:hypothetical protein
MDMPILRKALIGCIVSGTRILPYLLPGPEYWPFRPWFYKQLISTLSTVHEVECHTSSCIPKPGTQVRTSHD